MGAEKNGGIRRLFDRCLSFYVCSKCLNFSCPLNGVPKDVVDGYLRRNPVMMKAWEETGYKLDQAPGVSEQSAARPFWELVLGWLSPWLSP